MLVVHFSFISPYKGYISPYKARNSVNNEIKFAKKAHYMNAFHENESNVKKTWGIINELTSRKQNNSHVKEIKLNGSSVSDPPGVIRDV